MSLNIFKSIGKCFKKVFKKIKSFLSSKTFKKILIAVAVVAAVIAVSYCAGLAGLGAGAKGKTFFAICKAGLTSMGDRIAIFGSGVASFIKDHPALLPGIAGTVVGTIAIKKYSKYIIPLLLGFITIKLVSSKDKPNKDHKLIIDVDPRSASLSQMKGA